MKLLVFDSNSIVNRAFYGVKLLSTKDGQYTNAVYGFFAIVLKLIDDLAPDRVAFAFDLPTPTFRHNLYDGYKAQRKGMPEELAQQLPVVKQLITALGYPIVALEGYEADDVLGTFARLGSAHGDQVLLATGDRDSLQLVNDQVTVILAATRAGGAQYLRMTPQAVREQYGVEPAQLLETKALMGDSSDNIPGVKGIGEKTAFALIQRYGSVEALYKDLDAVEATPSVKKKLADGREMAVLSRKLGEVCCQAPVGDWLELTKPAPRDDETLYTVLSRLELHNLKTRLGLADYVASGGTPAQAEAAPEPPTAKAVPWDGSLPAAPALYFATLCQGDEITALAFTDGGDTVWVETAPTGERLLPLLTLPCAKYCDHTKPLHRLALAAGQTLEKVSFDCRLAGYLLSPNSSGYTIDRLAAEYGVPLPAPAWEGAENPDAVVVATLASAMPALCAQMEQAVERNGQNTLLREIEMPLAQVLASMELCGFRIDLAGLEQFGNEISALADGLEREIYALAGREFNVNSPKQLGELLFDELGLPHGKKTKSGYSTDAEVLEGLAPHHEIVSKILEYRKYQKLRST